MIARFFQYYKPHKRLFALDIFCAVVSGCLELAFPLAVHSFIDKLLPSQNWALILGAAAVLLGVYAVNTGLQFFMNYWGHVLGIAIETEMRRKIFDHLQKLSFSFFDNQKTGHLVGRVTKDLEDVGEVAHHGPEDALVAVMTFVGAFILMFTLNVQLALITGLVVPPMTFISTRYGSAMTKTWRSLFGRVGDFNTRIEENVGGIRVVKAFANEDHERELFAVDNGRYRETKLDAYRLMSKSMSLSYMTMRIIQLFVMIAGAYFVVHHKLTIGGFTGFLLLVNVFFRPVEKINAVLETYPKGIAGFKRYTELLDTSPDIVDAPDAISVPGFVGAIALRSVTKSTVRSSTASAFRSAPERRSPLWVQAGLARQRSVPCFPASTMSIAAVSLSTDSTSANSSWNRYASKSASSSKTCFCSAERSARTSPTAGLGLRRTRYGKRRGAPV